MVDLNRILSGLNNSGVTSSLSSGLAGGLAGGALAGAMSNKKSRKKLMKVGGLAAVGGLAWAAYRRYQNTQGQGQNLQGQNLQGQNLHGQNLRGQNTGGHLSPGTNQTGTDRTLPFRQPAAVGNHNPERWQQLQPEAFSRVVADTDSDNDSAMLIIRAMITAAMADGHIDRQEYQRIFDKVEELDMSKAEKALLIDELSHPLDVNEVIRQTSDPQTAIEVYAASLLAIDDTRPQGQAYLDRLAEGLDLPGTLVTAIHARADLATEREEAAA